MNFRITDFGEGEAVALECVSIVQALGDAVSPSTIVLNSAVVFDRTSQIAGDRTLSSTELSRDARAAVRAQSHDYPVSFLFGLNDAQRVPRR